MPFFARRCLCPCETRAAARGHVRVQVAGAAVCQNIPASEESSQETHTHLVLVARINPSPGGKNNSFARLCACPGGSGQLYVLLARLGADSARSPHTGDSSDMEDLRILAQPRTCAADSI